MKILAVGDLHFRKPWFEWVRAQAGNFDAVCLTGDLLDMFDTDERGLRRQADWVLRWLAIFPKTTRCFVVSGNHDVWEDDRRYHLGAWLQRARRAGISVDGDVTTVGDCTVVCWPWFGSVALPNTGKVIVVAHAPPAGCSVATKDGSDCGDIDVRFLAEKIQGGLILSGHVHQPKSWISRVGHAVCLNPGCDLKAPIPHHLVIDTTRGRAELRRFGENAKGALL